VENSVILLPTRLSGFNLFPESLSCIWRHDLDTCIVLSARRYEFKDDQGEMVRGVTFEYLTGDTGDGVNDKGSPVMKITGSPEVFGQLQAVPGVYDMDFKQRPGKNGRPSLQLVSVNFRQSMEAMLTPLRRVAVPESAKQ
jgi:hypothetical protein